MTSGQEILKKITGKLNMLQLMETNLADTLELQNVLRNQHNWKTSEWAARIKGQYLRINAWGGRKCEKCKRMS